MSLHRQSSFPPGTFAPYQIRLDNGKLIYAPIDEDRVVRVYLDVYQEVDEFDDLDDEVPEDCYNMWRDYAVKQILDNCADRLAIGGRDKMCALYETAAATQAAGPTTPGGAGGRRGGGRPRRRGRGGVARAHARVGVEELVLADEGGQRGIVELAHVLLGEEPTWKNDLL